MNTVNEAKKASQEGMEAPVKKMTDKDFDALARKFGQKAKAEGTTMVRIMPQEGREDIVPVIINGYPWYIKRGEKTEVPMCVARVLEEAGLI